MSVGQVFLEMSLDGQRHDEPFFNSVKRSKLSGALPICQGCGHSCKDQEVRWKEMDLSDFQSFNDAESSSSYNPLRLFLFCTKAVVCCRVRPVCAVQ